jgi:hypothetical protein
MSDETVRMWREFPNVPGGPLTADVHPAEVAHMQDHGWRLVESGSDAPPLGEVPEPPALEEMSLAQLRRIAKERGIPYTPQSTAQQIITAIRGA